MTGAPLQNCLFPPESQWQSRGKSQSFFRLLLTFIAVHLPLSYSGNPGADGVSYRGADGKRAGQEVHRTWSLMMRFQVLFIADI